jgi:hypothetical protein
LLLLLVLLERTDSESIHLVQTFIMDLLLGLGLFGEGAVHSDVGDSRVEVGLSELTPLPPSILH